MKLLLLHQLKQYYTVLTACTALPIWVTRPKGTLIIFQSSLGIKIYPYFWPCKLNWSKDKRTAETSAAKYTSLQLQLLVCSCNLPLTYSCLRNQHNIIVKLWQSSDTRYLYLLLLLILAIQDNSGLLILKKGAFWSSAGLVEPTVAKAAIPPEFQQPCPSLPCATAHLITPRTSLGRQRAQN